MRQFFKEAWERLGTAVPPFFVKLQLLGGAIGALGTGLAVIPFPAKLSFLNQVGPILTAVGGTMVLGFQFVMKASAILNPGQTLHNDTNKPVSVIVTPDDSGSGATTMAGVPLVTTADGTSLLSPVKEVKP